ncbi:unknow [Vibrio parahaemolyticus]|nr:unknow [Vibrio parahaemolyticus]
MNLQRVNIFFWGASKEKMQSQSIGSGYVFMKVVIVVSFVAHRYHI